MQALPGATLFCSMRITHADPRYYEHFMPYTDPMCVPSQYYDYIECEGVAPWVPITAPTAPCVMQNTMGDEGERIDATNFRWVSDESTSQCTDCSRCMALCCTCIIFSIPGCQWLCAPCFAWKARQMVEKRIAKGFYR